MSCFHPKTIDIFCDYSGKKPKHTFRYCPYDFDPTRSPDTSIPLMEMLTYKNKDFLRYHWYGQIPCPCGHCIGCRLDYAKKWRDRMLIESLSHSEKALFLTLTYNDNNLPTLEDGRSTLRIDDLTNFWKRLRNHFPCSKLMYYASSEYGSTTDRPHYHAILFGCPIPESWLQTYKYTREGNLLYKSDKLSNIWSYGFVTVGIASAKTMSYVARYTAKKAGSFDAEGKDKGREPPQSRCSLKPGIGLTYFYEHPDCINFDHINVGLPEGSFKVPVPDYYIRKYKESLSEDDLDDYLIKRCDKSILKWDLVFQNTDLSPGEYFRTAEDVLHKKTAILYRDEV